MPLKMIPRPRLAARVRAALGRSPVVALLGPRQFIVVHPGSGIHPLGDGLSASGLGALEQALGARKLLRLV